MGLLLNRQGELLTEDAQKAKLLNSYFTSVFTKYISYNQTINKNYLEREGDEVRDEITKETIRVILMNLN